MLSWATSRYAKIESIYKKTFSMILKFCQSTFKGSRFRMIGIPQGKCSFRWIFLWFLFTYILLGKTKNLMNLSWMFTGPRSHQKAAMLVWYYLHIRNTCCWFIFYKNFMFVEFSYHKRKSVGLRLMGSQN